MKSLSLQVVAVCWAGQGIYTDVEIDVPDPIGFQDALCALLVERVAVVSLEEKML